MADYQDRWIECDSKGIAVRGYYFPWGTKRVPWSRLEGVRIVAMDALHGKGRIWGTANPRYWASLDPARPGKSTGFVLNVGRFVRPFLTPDDPGSFLSAVRSHAPQVPVDGGPQGSPII